MKKLRHPYIVSGVMVYIITNCVLVLFMLLFPSFGMIRTIYNFNTIIVPILCLMVTALLFTSPGIRLSCPDHHVHIKTVYIIAAVMLTSIRIYATHYEPSRLVVKHVEIQTDKVTSPVRILHVSDIQSDGVGNYEKKAFEQMKKLEPDLVIHSGDLLQIQPKDMDTLGKELGSLAELFRTLNPPLGKYTVLGDVDWRIENTVPEDLGGVIMLNNRDVTLNHRGGTIELAGLRLGASRIGSRGSRIISNWLNETDSRCFRIVVGHDPSYAMSVKDMDVDLCLAGHTHGGQVCLPFLGPIITMTDAPRDWARGFRKIGRPFLNVSAGVGNEHKDGVPAIRFNCPTEMTLITLIPKAAADQGNESVINTSSAGASRSKDLKESLEGEAPAEPRKEI